MLERLSSLFVRRGVIKDIRSDNGGEFATRCVREWLKRGGMKRPYIAPGSPCGHVYVERFDNKLRDELLEPQVFKRLFAAKVRVTRWRWPYNAVRPHSALACRLRPTMPGSPARPMRSRLAVRTGGPSSDLKSGGFRGCSSRS